MKNYRYLPTLLRLGLLWWVCLSWLPLLLVAFMLVAQEYVLLLCAIPFVFVLGESGVARVILAGLALVVAYPVWRDLGITFGSVLRAPLWSYTEMSYPFNLVATGIGAVAGVLATIDAVQDIRRIKDAPVQDDPDIA